MLPTAFVKGYDRRRLGILLALLFAALALPTAVVTWQAYDQLKWEAWYQYRTQAESLTRRVSLELARAAEAADARAFSDYSFVNAAPASNVLQRSPLSVYPVVEDVPGTIGFFQLAPDGSFSTPLLPPVTLSSMDTGLAADDMAARESVAAYMTGILTDNALVSAASREAGRAGTDDRTSGAVVVPGSMTAEEVLDEVEAEALPTASTSPVARRSATRTDSDDAPATAADGPSVGQSLFDTLDLQRARYEPPGDASEADGEDRDVPAPASSLGKVRDLQLDDALEKKNEALSRQRAEPAAGTPSDAVRMQRAEPVPAAPGERVRPNRPAVITTFDSEIDPFEFAMLGSGHLVLYRNAWRDGDRYIQGMLLDGDRFARRVIESAFVTSPVAAMSDLILSYEDDIIDVFSGSRYDSRAAIDTGQFAGSLLFRSRLASPFDRLELIFSVDRLPPGPGASVLKWMSAIIGVVFVGGFVALYRLGLGQIRLAQQQQDFVSAVSHEVKTPLTSIRMYGEMLKEGWADEEKRRQYYDYIHDESERLSRLITNVLQLAQITRNEPRFDLQPVAVHVLMDQVQSRIANQAERSGFSIRLSLDEDARDRSIRIDDDCFAQVVINLVDNAIKFSKDAELKQVDIGCASDSAGYVTFSVRDFGPGIPRNQLRKIFRLFYRSETELTRETVGTGIGLAIVKQLTTTMGGTIDVVNREPGAEFRLRFPPA